MKIAIRAGAGIIGVVMSISMMFAGGIPVLAEETADGAYSVEDTLVLKEESSDDVYSAEEIPVLAEEATDEVVPAEDIPVLAEEATDEVVPAEEIPVLAEEAADDAVSAEEILEDRLDGEDLFDEDAMVFLQGLYLPDVTQEMSKASFWSQKVYEPDALLADQAAIDEINQTLLENDAATNMNDLKNWPSKATYNGERRNELNVSSATSDAQYCFNVGARYGLDGTYYPIWESTLEDDTEREAENREKSALYNIYQPMIDNCVEPEATVEMPYHYAICTNRTCLQLFPSEHPLWDDYLDPDFGYLWSTPVRVNEPLLLASKSADGNYYLAYSSCSSGWVPVADIAICQDKQEWFSAWDLPAEKTLVVYEDKMFTDDSYFAPETANRMLTMGTCLELVDEEEYADNPLIINRRAYNNHVVYLPVRNEDGSYRKEMTLIGENRDVYEGYLPLTAANIIDVALHQLGDPYGWGGMLLSNDCSGYVRDVYKCFGLDLPRNTTWQAAQPTCKYNLSGMTYEEKTEFLKDMPIGTVLIFNGHEMLYLGEDNGKLYVISSVSDLKPDEDSGVIRVRGGLINTLDVRRGKSYNYITWLEAIHTAVIPYYPEGFVPEYGYFITKGDGSSWRKTSGKDASFTIKRTVNELSALNHLTTVLLDGTALTEAEYTAKTDGVTVKLKSDFLETLAPGKHTVCMEFNDGNAPEAVFTVRRVANTISEVTAEKTLKYTTLKKKSQTFNIAATVKGKAKKTFKLASLSVRAQGYVTVSSNGKVTVKKGLKKGTYRLKVRITAAATNQYLKTSQYAYIKLIAK